MVRERRRLVLQRKDEEISAARKPLTQHGRNECTQFGQPPLQQSATGTDELFPATRQPRDPPRKPRYRARQRLNCTQDASPSSRNATTSSGVGSPSRKVTRILTSAGRVGRSRHSGCQCDGSPAAL